MSFIILIKVYVFYFGKFEKYRNKYKESIKKHLYSHHSEMISDNILVWVFFQH